MSNTGAFQYWQRTMIHSGAGAILRLPGLFAGLGARRILLLSDAGLKAAGIVDRVAAVFASGNCPAGVTLAGSYTEIAPDADIESIDAAVRFARTVAADAILAVGGGSVLDAAKIVKAALAQGVLTVETLVASPLTMLSWPEVAPSGIAHISVPTTAGTGAEVTNGAVVMNKASGAKHLYVAPFLESDIAVLDATVTTSLPPHLTAATGMDALTHALEIIALPSANDFALAHAMYAAQLILKWLPAAVADGSNIDARMGLLHASTMACNAVQNNFGPAPVHNHSHAIGALYHLHHGAANGVLLPIVIDALPEFYAPAAPRLAAALGVNASGTAAEVLDRVSTRIRRLMAETVHPFDFSDRRIPVSDVERAVMAVASDPLAMLYPLPPERITAILARTFGWAA